MNEGMYDTPLAAAQMYAVLGWRVVPVRPGEKVPIPKAWQDVATTNSSIIDAWWAKYPEAGVSIVAGKETGLWFLDVDVADGKLGMESLRALVDQHADGHLPTTCVARTPSGGYHYAFAWPDGVEIRNSAGNRLGPGLDVRGEGGHVVAAPTTRGEQAYRWAPGRAPWEAEVQPAPAWLVDLVCDKEDVRTSEPHIAAPVVGKDSILLTPPADTVQRFLEGRSLGGDGPPAWVEEYNRTSTWAGLLEADGWTLDHVDRDQVEHWVRPGKDRRQGTSATVNYGGHDCLYVYTTSLPWLPSDRMYDRYGYMVHRYHDGSFEAAAEAYKPAKAPTVADLLDVHNPTGEVDTDAAEEDSRTRLERAEIPLSSEDFWNAEQQDDEFLIEPFIGVGRAHALFAEAKAGKSYVVLQALAAAAVPGHESWTETPAEPVTILYLDYEMTENDLRERLEIFGYGPEDDYSHLHYVKASMLGGDLDTYEGGLELLLQAQRWGCQLVVIDTMSRAVTGEENDADTVRKFYQHTGRLLKANGIAWLRIDHAGKDKAKGQRGSSGKNDDVDVVWKLSRTDTGGVLELTHSRVFWMPSTIPLKVTPAGETGAVLHLRDSSVGYGAGTAEKARLWLELGIPLDASRRKAQQMGLVCTTALFSDVKRYVNQHAERHELVALAGSNHPANHPNHPPNQSGSLPGTPIGGQGEPRVVQEPEPPIEETLL